MDKILFVDACVRENSRTRILAEYLLERLEGEIERIELNAAKLLPLDADRLKQREELICVKNYEAEQLQPAVQFSTADVIVIAAPYWDLSFPALLKDYIENVTVRGVSFEYDEKGIPVGLCSAQKLIYVMTAGGFAGDLNMGFEYIKSLASVLYGISDVICIKAEGLDIEGNDVEAVMEKAKREISALF